MSPYEQVRQRMPPMIIISGVEDAVTPDAEARRYCERVSQKGGRCDIHSYERLGHLLSRKLDPKAQSRGDFDWDPTATSDAENKIAAPAFSRTSWRPDKPTRSSTVPVENHQTKRT